MKITQRTATLMDGEVLLNWRNDPSVRKFSMHSEIIRIHEHLKWLSERLERVRLEPFFLFTVDNKAIGMSRLDIISGSNDKFEISILVDPAQQGKGIGTRILNMACESFFRIHQNKTIVARVHKHNRVSQKLFMNGGFELRDSADEFLYFEKILKLGQSSSL